MAGNEARGCQFPDTDASEADENSTQHGPSHTEGTMVIGVPIPSP